MENTKDICIGRGEKLSAFIEIFVGILYWV